MDLLLVRHGVSEHNTSDVISGGTSNPNLSPYPCARASMSRIRAL